MLSRRVAFFFFAFFVLAFSIVACSSTTTTTTSPPDASAPAAEGATDSSPTLPKPTCAPKCSGKHCGTDGCGGSCGTCAPGEVCSGNRGTCAATCAPSCDGRACGDDGCGGSCGTCITGACGTTGLCECTKDADCGTGRACLHDAAGHAGCAPVCDVFASTCAAGTACAGIEEDGAGRGVAACVPEGASIEGDACTYDPKTGGSACGPGLSCIAPSAGASPVCMRFCDAAHACPKAGQTCVALAFSAGKPAPFSVCAPAMGPCQPNPCTAPNANACTVVGGAAHCACNPGYVDVGGSCIKPCSPNCAGKSCGPDGCGGSCGACAGAGEICQPSGHCCAPSCAGKNCGSDGCGGSCGSCGAGQICNASQTCQVCTPSCAGKACGPDGCGGTCGFCAAGVCDGAGKCVCTPKCAGKNCGDDGCGGSCGSCGAFGNVCRAGLCTDPNFCGGEPCYASNANGGCCASSAYCVRGMAAANTSCRSTCGASGEGCRDDAACCAGLSCFGNVCQ